MQEPNITGISFIFHNAAAAPGCEDLEFKADMSEGAPRLNEQAAAFYSQVSATMPPPVEYRIAFELDRELTTEELGRIQAIVGDRLVSYGPAPQ